MHLWVRLDCEPNIDEQSAVHITQPVFVEDRSCQGQIQKGIPTSSPLMALRRLLELCSPAACKQPQYQVTAMSILSMCMPQPARISLNRLELMLLEVSCTEAAMAPTD